MPGAVHWIALSIIVLAVDYATEPFINVTILFVIPVALATMTHGPMVGVGVATMLPLIRRWAFPPPGLEPVVF